MPTAGVAALFGSNPLIAFPAAPGESRPTLPTPPMDYRIYHAINQFVFHHSWLGSALADVENWAVPVVAVTTFGLWLLARPGGTRKWKLASATALASAGLALLVNQLIAQVWHRERPFATHPSAHIWGGRSNDPSFPSDHASAAFAIAFAVIFLDLVAGSLFLAAAVIIGVGRIFIGAHYPGDVIAGCLVGLACAVIIARLARPAIESLVRLIERLTDPVVAFAWRWVGTSNASR